VSGRFDKESEAAVTKLARNCNVHFLSELQLFGKSHFVLKGIFGLANGLAIDI